MAEFDVIISGGMVVDGTRLPRYQADVGIKDGKIAKIGNLKGHQAKKVIDAGGQDRRARLRRSAYALRCAALLGSVLHDFELARRHLASSSAIAASALRRSSPSCATARCSR